MMLVGLTPAEELVVFVILLETLAIVLALSAIAGLRALKQRDERALGQARDALAEWYTQALLGQSTPERDRQLEATLGGLRANAARALLTEMGERLAAEGRSLLGHLFLKLGYTISARPAALWARLILVREARALQDPLGVLSGLIADEDLDVRVAAFEALAELGRLREAFIALEPLAHGGPLVRIRLIDALVACAGSVGNGAESVAEALAQLVQSGSAEAKQVALCALGAAKILQAAPLFGGCLSDPDHEVRIQALRAYRELADPSQIEHCLPCLQDEAWEVRSEAVRTCAVLGGEAIAERIAAQLADGAEWVRHNAAYALLRCGPRGQSLLERAAEGGAVAAVSALAEQRLREATP